MRASLDFFLWPKSGSLVGWASKVSTPSTSERISLRSDVFFCGAKKDVIHSVTSVPPFKPEAEGFGVVFGISKSALFRSLFQNRACGDAELCVRCWRYDRMAGRRGKILRPLNALPDGRRLHSPLCRFVKDVLHIRESE